MVMVITLATGVGAIAVGGAVATEGAAAIVATVEMAEGLAAGVAASQAAAAAATSSAAVASTIAGTGALVTETVIAAEAVVATTTVSTAGSAGLLALLGPYAMPVLVGASFDATWDCWKPIVHDESSTPSKGIFLMDLIGHQNVKSTNVIDSNIIIENVWNERFVLQPVCLPDGQVALHSKIISN